ncbi:MAG: hypothetical protein ACRDSR_05425 [Pseudonocardiaceae bacterium]
MDTISPVVIDAFTLLHLDLYGHLDKAEYLASKDKRWCSVDVDAARELIPDLVDVIRGLLVDHEPQPDGSCQICTSGWPCSVATTIHSVVKDPDRAFVALLHRDHDHE